ncbi:MAG TPA: SDR family NAD(P)-dependent oxidoreductase [Steroidobacteraceae bacterium]|jgi:NAD(P)-dependent dehydrogenase (short-subunit alcohol dehydrogenase family)
MKIGGKVAVVTGGASGIGQAVVNAFIERGGQVAIFDLNEAAGHAMAIKLGSNAIFEKVNVADEPAVIAAIAKTTDSLGAIHVCVNCAGIGSAHKTFGKDGPFPLAAWNKTIAVNLTGTFNVARLCAEQMAKNEPSDSNGSRGVIVNIASVAAFDGQIGQVAYSASKAGIVGMTLPMARDLSGIGVRVNTIAPGLIETPLLAGLPAEVLDGLAKSVLYPKRLGKPGEIAQLAIAIIENDYMNGECIRVDGGIRMQPR